MSTIYSNRCYGCISMAFVRNSVVLLHRFGIPLYSINYSFSYELTWFAYISSF